MKAASIQENHSWLLYPSTTSEHLFYGAAGSAVTLPLTKIIAIYILTPSGKYVEVIFRYWVGPLVDGKYVEAIFR